MGELPLETGLSFLTYEMGHLCFSRCGTVLCPRFPGEGAEAQGDTCLDGGTHRVSRTGRGVLRAPHLPGSRALGTPPPGSSVRLPRSPPPVACTSQMAASEALGRSCASQTCGTGTGRLLSAAALPSMPSGLLFSCPPEETAAATWHLWAASQPAPRPRVGPSALSQLVLLSLGPPLPSDRFWVPEWQPVPQAMGWDPAPPQLAPDSTLGLGPAGPSSASLSPTRLATTSPLCLPRVQTRANMVAQPAVCYAERLF